MIKTIIFDWGGVLTATKHTYAILDVLSDIREFSKDDIYEGFDWLIVEMNKGNITFFDFVKGMNDRFGFKLSEDEMKDVFKRAIRPNRDVIDLITKLHFNYNLILMSDNDPVTVEFLQKYHREMMDQFSECYFSCDFKTRKPDLKFFRHVIEESGLVPAECIFVDDKQKNVDAAKKCGLNVIRFEDCGQLRDELKNFSVATL